MLQIHVLVYQEIEVKIWAGTFLQLKAASEVANICIQVPVYEEREVYNLNSFCGLHLLFTMSSQHIQIQPWSLDVKCWFLDGYLMGFWFLI